VLRRLASTAAARPPPSNTSHVAVLPCHLLITTALRDGSVTDVHGPASPPCWRCRRLRRRSGFVMQDSTGSSDLAISVVMESTSPTEQSTYFL